MLWPWGSLYSYCTHSPTTHTFPCKKISLPKLGAVSTWNSSSGISSHTALRESIGSLDSTCLLIAFVPQVLMTPLREPEKCVWISPYFPLFQSSLRISPF